MKKILKNIYILDFNTNKLIRIFYKTRAYDMTRHKIWIFFKLLILVVCLHIVSYFKNYFTISETNIINNLSYFFLFLLIDYVSLTIIANIIMKISRKSPKYKN